MPPDADRAFREFLNRCWQRDIAPLLRDEHAAARARAARIGGRAAAAAGLALDKLFGLRGKPFARSMTVLGGTVGALAPDVWDWKWLCESATADQQDVVDEQVRARAAALEHAEALALFELTPSAPLEGLKHAWREASKRWHPDVAPCPEARQEHHLRFLAYQAAYERLRAAYESGVLPARC